MGDPYRKHLDVEAIRQACNALLDLNEVGEPIYVSPSDSLKLQILHGLCQQALNHARAALVVLDAGLQLEAGANVRAALEHAVTAQWGLLSADGVGRIVEGAKYKAAVYYESASSYVQLNEEMLGQVSEWKMMQKLPNFASMCDDLDGTHDPQDPKSGLLRFEYVRLSQTVHVTSNTITSHLHIDPLVGDMQLRSQALDQFATVTLLNLGMAVAMASWVIESLRSDPARQKEVERIADEANLPSSLVEDFAIAQRRKRAR